MIPLSISLNHKNVLIVGGGKVAFRKATLFIKEKAHVTVVSPDLIHQFEQLNITYLQDMYHSCYLNKMFLVYAATNDQAINHQIVLECQKKNILCGSATYEKNASFYSVAYKEHPVGTLALSMHQKLPYIQPLLDHLIDVLDKNQSRIEKIEALRPLILKYVDNKQNYFHDLYTCEEKIIDFLCLSIKENQGTLLIYHDHPNDKHFEFSLYPYLVLSLKELKQYLHLFIFPIEYQVIPLFLHDGYLYQQLDYIIPYHWKINPPLIYTSKDIQFLSSLFYQNGKEMIYMIHPRRDSRLKDLIISEIHNQGKVYDFLQEVQWDIDKTYYIVIMLMNEGKHYHDVVNQIKILQQKGYYIEYSQPLMSYNQIRKYIEEKSL